MQENTNKRTVASPPGDRPLSLPELLALFEVDENVWKVERFLTNSWPIGVKVEEKDLTFNKGVISGSVKSEGKIATKRLYQTKAWLARRVLEPSTVTLVPISVSVNKTNKQHPERVTGRTALILPDPQFGFANELYKSTAIPFHDRVAIDAVIQVAIDLGVDDVIWAGDILDMSEWSSKFLTRPEFRMTTQAALIEASWTIGRLVTEFPDARHVAMLGNHEDRLQQFMIRNMEAAYGLKPADQLDLGPMFSIDNLLGLQRMGVEYIGEYPNGELWLNKFFKVVHGYIVRSKSGGTASAMVDGALVSQMFGHIHRRELATSRVRAMSEDRAVWAATPGCLCHVDGRVPGSKLDANWQKGAAIVTYDRDGEYVSTPEFIDVEDGVARFRGQAYKGEDRFDELVEMTSGLFDWNSYEPTGTHQ